MKKGIQYSKADRCTRAQGETEKIIQSNIDIEEEVEKAMFKTRITELFGIEHPIVQGALLWLSRAELVSAVSNAGGLGILASFTFSTPEEVRQEIKKTKSMTNKPFAVNIPLFPTVRPVEYEEFIRVAVEEGVTIIETAGRNPEPYMKLLKNSGVKIMHKCARIKDVKTAERLGVDAVTIVGFEGGGHPGVDDIGSSVLFPTAANSVKIPVIAAGGIGDARGFIAALALGTEGVTIGTRFMACKECPTHDKIKEWMLSARETDTVMIERSINNAMRVMRTDFAQEILEGEAKGITLEELLPFLAGALGKRAVLEGDINAGTIPCGQVVGLINNIPTVKEFIDGIINQAKEIVKHLNDIKNQ